jgi:hypothetical protein
MSIPAPQPTGHANDGSSSYGASSRVSRLLSGGVREHVHACGAGTGGSIPVLLGLLVGAGLRAGGTRRRAAGFCKCAKDTVPYRRQAANGLCW